jgi:hypothetical protein
MILVLDLASIGKRGREGRFGGWEDPSPRAPNPLAPSGERGVWGLEVCGSRAADLCGTGERRRRFVGCGTPLAPIRIGERGDFGLEDSGRRGTAVTSVGQSHMRRGAPQTMKSLPPLRRGRPEWRPARREPIANHLPISLDAPESNFPSRPAWFRNRHYAMKMVLIIGGRQSRRRLTEDIFYRGLQPVPVPASAAITQDRNPPYV